MGTIATSKLRDLAAKVVVRMGGLSPRLQEQLKENYDLTWSICKYTDRGLCNPTPQMDSRMRDLLATIESYLPC